MALPSKYVVGGAVVALAISFAAGRYSAPQKVVTETKTSTQQDAQKQVDTDKDQHVQTVTTQVKKPDGTMITKTTTTKDTETKQQLSQDVKTDTKTDSKTEITKSSSPVTINALLGADVTNLSGGLVYGLSISRPILGPITIGAWGMTNKTGGFSLGIQF